MVIQSMDMGTQVMAAIRRANEHRNLPEIGRVQEDRRMV
jgi:hypothetical protein